MSIILIFRSVLSGFFFLMPLFYMDAMLLSEVEGRPRSRSGPINATLKAGEKDTIQKPRRNSLNFEPSGSTSAINASTVVSLEYEQWVHLLYFRTPPQPSIEIGDYVVIPVDSSQLLLDCKIHYQPGPGEGIFDGDPTQVEKYRPYFVYNGGWSSIMLTPLTLLAFSDEETLKQTKGDFLRAIGTLKLLLIAQYALDDLSEDRQIDDRVYRLNTVRLKALGDNLFERMLSQENKPLEDLQNLPILAQIANNLVLNILSRIGYSDKAIQNLIRLAKALQERSVEANMIPATYEGLLKMYDAEPADLGSASTYF